MLKLGKFLLLILILLFPIEVKADFKFWQSNLVFSEPLATLRSPELSIQIAASRKSNYIKAAIGREFGLITLETESYLLQLGVQAGAWLHLSYGSDLQFPLITEDFLIAFPLALKLDNNLSIVIKWSHISAHLGDGANSSLEPVTFSRDFISILLIHQVRRNKPLCISEYINGGYIYNNHPEDAKNYILNTGLDIDWEFKIIHPYIAVDFGYNNGFGLSGQIGFILSTYHFLNVRVGLTGYIGADKRGQFFEGNIEEIGIGMFVR